VSYDPFSRGRFPVGVRTLQAHDAARERLFPCEMWYPAAARHAGEDNDPATQDRFVVAGRDAPRSQMAVRDATAEAGTYPLVVYSHGSAAGGRRMATFLCTHLASHGYVVAAPDHFELVATELAPTADETEERRKARAQAWIGNRVPDIRFILDYVLGGRAARDPDLRIDPERVGVAGYSFGGWTVLAATEADRRIRAVVALAPAGSSKPKPGILPATLGFAWGRDVPTLYLVAENDVMTPLDGMYELYQRTQSRKRMLILRRADHLHFLDQVEQEHEAARAMPWAGKLAWIPKEMRPISELCSGEQAHLFAGGLALAHLDAVLGRKAGAERFLNGDIEAALAARGVEAIACAA
jgi:predicted dienelactone hydrolase